MNWYCLALIARNQETAPVDVNIWQKLIRSDNLWSVLAAAFVLIKEIALPMKCDQMILFWWIIPGFVFFFVQTDRHNAYISYIFKQKRPKNMTTQTISTFFLPYSFQEHTHKRDAILIDTLF